MPASNLGFLMALRQVLLVYLESGTAAGYDIVKGFQRTYGYFWNASFQQIYRDLAKLHTDGLIDCETVSNGSRPARKVYRINEQGRAEMRKWLATPVRLPHVNDDLLVKLASVHLLDRKVFLEQWRQHRQGYLDALKELNRNRVLFDALPPPMLRQVYGVYLSLKRGIRIIETWLEWADEVEAFLMTEPARISPEDITLFNQLLRFMNPDIESV